MTPTTIGFVGLGHMGGNMAARLLAAGYPVSGESRSRDAVEHLIGEGLTWRDTPREVAEHVEIVLTSIPNDDVLRDVSAGPDGILAGLAPGKTWVDLSTVSPQASREVAERVHATGAAMLDARSPEASPRCSRGR